LERAPKRQHGGNSRFTMAAMRFAYRDLDELRQVDRDLTPQEIEGTDFGSYPEADFIADLDRVTGGRCRADLAEVLVAQSRPTLSWIADHGVGFVPLWDGQSHEVDGRRRFWGGLTLQAQGGGPGLVLGLRRAACRAGIPVLCERRARSLVLGSRGVTGLDVETAGGTARVEAGAVVLACGGYEADRDWRRRHLGPSWEHAKVRGTRFNTGDGIRMALEAGAQRGGDWQGCHAVQWDRGAPDYGDLQLRHVFQKHSYPLGILLNADGRRFLDEGADFRNFTYARYGAAVLEQPGHFAWQVFDAKVQPLLREEYAHPSATRVEAATLEELVGALAGVDADEALRAIAAFNRAVAVDVPFDPTVLDGRGTRGLEIAKSNWANRLDTPPFEAYAVTCGITFTFGGVAIDTAARVLDEGSRPIPGLFAAGEMAGGLFWGNYPGGSGLTAGSVFGRIAGRSAARHAS
ncbi:MAG: FAD-dependent tricarballylate dehydrogenase TcuA, partial [Thermoanaerobaculia bacterium]|nr:FAD-dependent tricarballylate dehydrogenase TcuA [Thermoanaerobaculia bacterium]